MLSDVFLVPVFPGTGGAGNRPGGGRSRAPGKGGGVPARSAGRAERPV